VSRRALPAAACALALALAGGACGGGDDEPDEPDQVAPAQFAELLSRLPSAERSAIALDVHGARRELGLRADAAPPAPPDHGTDGERRLRGLVAATVLNYPIKDNGPLDRAVDYRLVTGLARVDGPPEVLLIATRQPWADLRAALEREGWRERRDGLLERPADSRSRVLRWVAGRDGLAVAAGDPRAAPAVRDGRERTAPALRALLDAAGGPARAARVAESRCIRGFAAGYSPAAASGRFVVAVSDVPPLPYRLKPARGRSLSAAYALQTPRAAGGRVEVPFTFEASTDPSAQPTALALGSSPFFRYAC
jgi:hypothetical protein